MPLLRRLHADKPHWFIRFVDFAVPPRPDGTRVCDFHMVVVAGDASEGGDAETILHRTSRMRVWSPEELEGWFRESGFVEVRASGSMDDPGAPPRTEDVFLSAVVPRG